MNGSHAEVLKKQTRTLQKASLHLDKIDSNGVGSEELLAQPDERWNQHELKSVRQVIDRLHGDMVQAKKKSRSRAKKSGASQNRKKTDRTAQCDAPGQPPRGRSLPKLFEEGADEPAIQKLAKDLHGDEDTPAPEFPLLFFQGWVTLTA